MATRSLLIEIGTEEMPARFATGACEQLKDKVTAWLTANRISYGEAAGYETPRRFAVLITHVNEQQEDVNEELRGPAKKIAVDDNGAWTKAALGFARGKGLNAEDLYLQEVNGVEYVFARKHQAGQSTQQLLPALRELIVAMSFPKNMRWGAHDVKFVRPIRWMVALFGTDIIPFEIAGVHTGNTSRGHRFLGDTVTIERPEDYTSRLAEQYVMVNPEERRARILSQIREMETQKGWSIPTEEGLLDEVVHLVEYPTTLSGGFEEEYLHIPREVLVTSMREHQRYFPVENKDGELLPYFVTVRNGDDKGLETVAKGNEKVLRARLSDARFFYEEDQKMKIDDALKRLETVVFHEELGTIGDKIRRVREAALSIADSIQIPADEKQKIDRAASIAKFDLVSHMVYEFPELQGIMGERYARLLGEDQTVAQAIFEHYLPRFAGDKLPETETGAVLSIADKIDTIAGCFAIGIIPTGSADPYALRRQATGIVQILLDRGVSLTLDTLFSLSLAILEDRKLLKRGKEEVKKDLQDFFTLRLKNLLQERGIRYDLIDAVLAVDTSNVGSIVKRADVLRAIFADETEKGADFKVIVDSFNRVNNLAKKAEATQVNPGLFETDAERQLWNAFADVKAQTQPLLDQADYLAAFHSMAKLHEPINAFFDNVMVMVDDENVKNNRLAMLVAISGFVFGLADFSKIVFA
ncbi:glycine--tRNA ligase subunit beta [Aneurinibacillus sp. Ricciae_BoGa-3]|uniref:glycine--tRNA ligase subunit beta n=1 Tax=Aneurinibacillus sp. Ricciae_BoGa-3 TaxID=3022697 RepID=UPI002340E6E7|nr:glycine--tRNA ligase subunit beta [Aneurinibacillus sp. Ricciae_BoGa-3]WCK53458.1 glycine--tRNA ligase subunit beta [Aneurinibacillus sp. Ricciae_BoGa-3]